MPMIASCGTFCFLARVIANTAVDWAQAHRDTLDEIRLVAFDPTTATAFRLALRTQGSH